MTVTTVVSGTPPGPTRAADGERTAYPTQVCRPPTSAAAEAVVRLEGVEVRLGGLPILRDIDLALEPGRCHGLVGGNGSGKTTLMRATLGLVRLSAGRIERQQISGPGRAMAVFGPRLLHPGRRARTELALRVWGGGGSQADIDAAWTQARIPSDSVRCGTLSLGQAHRLSLAAALALRPRLLVLDEPTVGLDTASVTWLREGLRALVDGGTCVWISSHDLSEIERVVDTITLLEGGRLVRTEPMSAFRAAADQVRVDGAEPEVLRERLVAAGATVQPAPEGPLLVSGMTPGAIGALASAERLTLTELTPVRPALGTWLAARAEEAVAR